MLRSDDLDLFSKSTTDTRERRRRYQSISGFLCYYCCCCRRLRVVSACRRISRTSVERESEKILMRGIGGYGQEDRRRKSISPRVFSIETSWAVGCWWSRTMDPSICRYARVVPETITSMFTSTGGCELASRVVHFGCEWKDNPVPAVRLLIYEGTRRAPSTPPPLVSRRRPGALVSCGGGGGGDGHPPARTWGFPRRFPSTPSSGFPCSVAPSTAAGNLMAAARDHGGGPEALRTCIAARAYRHYYYYGLLGRENSPTFNPPSEIARNFNRSLFYFFHQRLASSSLIPMTSSQIRNGSVARRTFYRFLIIIFFLSFLHKYGELCTDFVLDCQTRVSCTLFETCEQSIVAFLNKTLHANDRRLFEHIFLWTYISARILFDTPKSDFRQKCPFIGVTKQINNNQIYFFFLMNNNRLFFHVLFIWNAGVVLCKNYLLSKYYLNNENFFLNDFSIACF